MIRIDFSQRHDLEGLPNQIYLSTKIKGQLYSTAICAPTEFKNMDQLEEWFREIGRGIKLAFQRVREGE